MNAPNATPITESVPPASFLPLMAAPSSRWTAAVARTVMAAAGAAVAFGCVYILAAWRHPGAPPPDARFPFTYSTVLGMGLLGLAAALLAGRRWRAAFVLGIFIASAGALGAAVELLGVHGGTDRLFGFGASIGFTAAGTATVLLAAGPAFGGAAAAAAAALLMLSTAALAGTAFGLSAGAALEWTRLAPTTAAGFGVLGAAFLVFAGYRPDGLAGRRLQWVPETAALAALLFTVVAWQALRASEWLAMGVELAAQNARLKDSLRGELEKTAATLERQAKRWDFYRAQPVERQYDAALLLADFPTLRAVAWTDARGAVLASMPRAEKDRAAAWAAGFSQTEQSAPRARRIDLGGRPGIVLFLPLREGFSLALVDMGLLAQRAWQRLDIHENFGVAVEDGEGPLLVQGPRVDPAREAVAGLEWRGLSWRLRLWRSPGSLPTLPYSTVGFILGLVFCALVYETALLTRRLRRRAAQVHAVRQELAHEASRRNEAERGHEEKKHLLQLTSAVLAGREQSLGMALREVTESRDRLRALAAIVDSSEDAIIGKDAQAVVTSWNSGAEKMYGYKREEMIGKSMILLAPPEQSEEVRELTRRVFRGETIRNLETVRISKDGSRIEVSLGISPVRDAAGVVVAASVVARDITHKKRAEETLHRNEALIREVLESLPVGLSIADETGAIVTQNQKMRELWSDRGIIVEDSPERKGWWADTGRALTPGDWPLARAVALGETSLGNTIEVEAWDGTRKTLVCNAVPLRDSQGRLAGGIEVQEDVTERRRAEQALALHSVILRNMKEGVCLIRASDAVIVYTNPKFEDMYGYAPGELMGLEAGVLNQTGPEDGHAKNWRRITDDLVHGGEAVYELHSRKKDGTPFWCAAHTSEFTHPAFGKVWVAVHEDITEKKNAENRLRQSLQEKEVLLQEVHHRVKNNMQIISSLLQLQSQHIKNPRVLQVVRESRSRIRSMALIHEKLYRSGDLARVQFGDYVKSLAADVVRSFNTGARTPAVKLDIVPVDLDLDTAIPLGLLVNELVANAVKHAFPNKDDGEILVELKSAGTGKLTLRVKDTGVGFKEAPPAEGEDNGSFGLRLVRILSEQLGGKAEIKSGPGVEFRVTFPMGARSALHADLNPAVKV